MTHHADILKCAEAHGNAEGSDSEIADLQTLFSTAFAMLDDRQKAAFLADPEIAGLFELPEYATVRRTPPI